MVLTNERAPVRMLIGRDRLFYTGLLGNAMTRRSLGSLTVYVSPDEHLEIDRGDGRWMRRRAVAIPAFQSHRVRTPSGNIATICLEPETIDRASMEVFVRRIEDSVDEAQLVDRVLQARRDVMTGVEFSGFSAADFDQFFFGLRLERRDMDARIRRVLEMIVDDLQDRTISAGACARHIGLSTSRFLHLFKEHTDIPFRSQRMWKRARRFMDHANRDDSLTEIALDLGYPDSSHFSHSIRSAFGLKPRSIRDGSRGMKICLGENYVPSYAAR